MMASDQAFPTRAKEVNPEPAFIAAVFHALTWNKFAVTQALSLILALVRYLHGLDQDSPPYSFQTQIIGAAVGAVYVLIAALVADEAVRRGWRARCVFPVSLLVAACATACTQWYLRSWLGLLVLNAGPPLMRMLEVVIDVCAFGGLAMMAYLQRRNAQRLLEGVRSGELARLQVERELIESRLAATQAQLDPEEVLKQLTSIRDLFRAGDPAAAEHLDALTRKLRADVTRLEPGIRAGQL